MRDRIAGHLAAQFFFASLFLSSVIAHAESNVSERFTEEIVVTAEKKESALQSTPIAITAIGQEAIRFREIQNMDEVQYLAPGVSFNQFGPTGFVSMRGVGMEFTVISAEAGVGMYTDGVYRGTSMSAVNSMFDLERIEVVRGPQGTLNGRNSTGGSVNLISRLPGDEAAFEASFMYGDYDRYRVILSGDMPISENFAIRIAGMKDERDGYAYNSTLNTEEDDSDITLIKGSALFTPRDDLEFIFRFEHSDVEVGGPLYLATASFPVAPFRISHTNPGGALAEAPGICGATSCVDALGLSFPDGVSNITDPRATSGGSPTEASSATEGYSLTVNYDISEDITLRYIGSYHDQEYDAVRDIDGTTLGFFDSIRAEEMDEKTHELTLLGNTGKLDWVFGGYYYKSNTDHLGQFFLPDITPFFEAFYGLAFLGGAPLPAGSLAAFGLRATDDSPSAIAFLDDAYTEETTSNAVYAQATYSITDSFRATVGLRNTKDEKVFTQTSRDNILTGDICTNNLSENDWRETTGKVGVDFDLSNGSLLYGSISRGYKSGGFDGGACFDDFEPEVLTAYEVGLKTQLLDDSMRMNLSAFVYDYEDYQARLFIPTGTQVLNAPGADIQGAEIEINWLVTEQLRIDGSISYLDTEFQNFEAQNPMRPELGFVNLDGNSLLRAPEIQATLILDYDIPTESGLLTLSGEWAFMDEQYFTLFNDPEALEPSRNMINLRIRFEPSRAALENVSVTAFVNNVSDEEYANGYVLSGFTGAVNNTFGPPRTWGVQINYATN